MMSKRCVQHLNHIGQQEGSKNHRRKKGEREIGRVHIRPISKSHKIRIISNFGMRLTTTSSVDLN